MDGLRATALDCVWKSLDFFPLGFSGDKVSNF